MLPRGLPALTAYHFEGLLRVGESVCDFLVPKRPSKKPLEGQKTNRHFQVFRKSLDMTWGVICLDGSSILQSLPWVAQQSGSPQL